jgi:hypothetical protein
MRVVCNTGQEAGRKRGDVQMSIKDEQLLPAVGHGLPTQEVDERFDGGGSALVIC